MFKCFPELHCNFIMEAQELAEYYGFFLCCSDKYYLQGTLQQMIQVPNTALSEAVHNLIILLFCTPTQRKRNIRSALGVTAIEIINKNQSAISNVFKKQ